MQIKHLSACAQIAVGSHGLGRACVHSQLQLQAADEEELLSHRTELQKEILQPKKRRSMVHRNTRTNTDQTNPIHYTHGSLNLTLYLNLYIYLYLYLHLYLYLYRYLYLNLYLYLSIYLYIHIYIYIYQ